MFLASITDKKKTSKMFLCSNFLLRKFVGKDFYYVKMFIVP